MKSVHLSCVFLLSGSWRASLILDTRKSLTPLNEMRRALSFRSRPDVGVKALVKTVKRELRLICKTVS